MGLAVYWIPAQLIWGQERKRPGKTERRLRGGASKKVSQDPECTNDGVNSLDQPSEVVALGRRFRVS